MISVIVMRDPISRLLAGDGTVNRKYPNVAKGVGTEEEYWSFAKDRVITNNYALRILSDCDVRDCRGAHTSPVYLEKAKALVRRFTFVLDIECLGEGLDALANVLGFTLNKNDEEIRDLMRNSYEHPNNRDRIPYPEVYEYLLKRNALDIELHEWSKSLALVNCSSVGEPI